MNWLTEPTIIGKKPFFEIGSNKMIKEAKLLFDKDKDGKPCLGWETNDGESTCLSGTAYDLEEAVLDLLESNGTISNKLSRLEENDKLFIVGMFKAMLDILNSDINHLMKEFYDR